MLFAIHEDRDNKFYGQAGSTENSKIDAIENSDDLKTDAVGSLGQQGRLEQHVDIR